MSVLTKIFVVLVTFLSVVLVLLVVPFVAKTDDYKAQLNNMTVLRQQALAMAQSKQLEILNAEEGRSAAEAQLQSVARRLEDKIKELSADRADLEVEVTGLRAEVQQAAVNQTHLAATAKQQAQILHDQRLALESTRNRYAEAQKRLVETNDELDARQSQLESMQRSVSQLQERQVAVREELDQLKGWWLKVPKATREMAMGTGELGPEEPFVALTPIHGRVTRVKDFEDETLVQLDVGEADGVAANMKFWVRRGDQYMGTVVITLVEPNTSAGRVRFAKENEKIAVDDQVITGEEDL